MPDESKKAFFIAPIENPAISFFMDFEKSGINLYSESNELKQVINKITEFRETLSKKSESCKPEDFFYNIKNIADLSLGKLFFYFETPQNFGIFLSGRFPLDYFKKLFPSVKPNSGEDFSVTIEVDMESVSQLLIDFKSNLISICPANSAGNILFPVENNQIKISPKYNAFRKMVTAGAALAFEADFTSMLSNLKKAQFIIPEELKSISHVRLVSDPRMLKAQFFIPDDEKRNIYNESIKTLLKSNMLSSSTFIANLNLEEKGNSLFLSHPASDEAVKTVGTSVGGTLIHFLVCNQTKMSKQKQASLSKAILKESTADK